VADSNLKGSECGQAKLNEKLIKLIRHQHARKEELKKQLDARYSAAAFAARYQVSPNTIHKVLTYATWRHVL
jgi:hypothetical protein